MSKIPGFAQKSNISNPLRPIRIGPVRIDAPVLLAPMSGTADLPFRTMARKYSAPLVFSEMIASREMINDPVRHIRKLGSDCAEEHPMAVQLAGYCPDLMAEAARINEACGAAIIDINFGCPAKKVVNGRAGSAILRDEGLAGRIVEATVKAVSVPVTVKMRTGWDATNRNAPQVARIAERAGARMITVHGRTRAQFYKGKSDWRFVSEVKAAVNLPVIVNGDIVDAATARRALAMSGADGAMIGRGAFGRPWAPAEIAAELSGGPAVSLTQAEIRDACLEHYDLILRHHGLFRGVRIARKHLGWYAAGLRESARFRETVFRSENPKQVRIQIRRLFDADRALPPRVAA